ncbi:MAG: T9SS type A sorting domain-containing protein, partial [Ignavibacteriaceae bacterium]|nr:T9SS type A sorting domain-containing protein [Ignavibacteriaceae bacterium]
TVMGNGYYYQDQKIMRVLVYDELAASLEPGQYLYLNMPFSISNPRDIKIDYVVLADEENNAINKLSIQVIYGDAPQLPVEYSLSQNYPNPFNPTTAIEFSVPKTSDVVISIYDMLGQEVRTLYTGEVQRGTYSVQWDGLNNSGSKMSSGSYIYRMIAGEFAQSKKMILMK